MGSAEGARKTRQKLIEKYGGEAGYKAHMKSLSLKGNQTPGRVEKSNKTRLERDPDFFKKFSKKGVLARAKKVE